MRTLTLLAQFARYPDLVVHRQLKAMLHEKDWVYNEEEMASLSEHCSHQARIAQLIEWELGSNDIELSSHAIREPELECSRCWSKDAVDFP